MLDQLYAYVYVNSFFLVVATQKKIDEGVAAKTEADKQLKALPAEKALADALDQASESTRPFFAAGQYDEALAALAALREPVDRFFDDVMVMMCVLGRIMFGNFEGKRVDCCLFQKLCESQEVFRSVGDAMSGLMGLV